MLKKLLIPGLGIVALAVLSGIAFAGVPCSGTSTVVITENSVPCTNAANICPAGDRDTIKVEVIVLDCYGTALAGKTVTITPATAGFVFKAADSAKVLVTDALGKVSAGYKTFGGCGDLKFQAISDGVTLGPSATCYIANFDNATSAPTAVVNALDLSQFGQNYGSTTWKQGDYDCNGVVNALDLSPFGQHYGHSMP